MTLQKEKSFTENTRKRVNVRKILSLDEVLEKPYSRITIELKENFNVSELSQILSKNGDTQVNLIVNEKSQKAHYSLQKNRKFDFNLFEALKAKDYVKKITF